MSEPEANLRPAQHHKSEGRKLHKDWRLWVMVVLMLAAILIYVATLDLR